MICRNYMNDSLRSDVFVRYQPETIACACIYLSARLLKISLPKQPSWFLVFGVKEDDIQELCTNILRLYTRPKPDADKLEKEVEELRKAHQEAKIKARLPAINSTTSFSPSSAPASPGKKSPSHETKTENGSGLASSSHHRDRDQNHVNSHKRKSHNNRSSPGQAAKLSGSSSGGGAHSRSPSPKKKSKTPPRGYKEQQKGRSRSRSRERSRKDSKHHHRSSNSSSHKRKRSHSHTRNQNSNRSPHRHSSKKYYKDRNRR